MGFDVSFAGFDLFFEFATLSEVLPFFVVTSFRLTCQEAIDSLVVVPCGVE
jgi:hypothetical protein